MGGGFGQSCVRLTLHLLFAESESSHHAAYAKRSSPFKLLPHTLLTPTSGVNVGAAEAADGGAYSYRNAIIGLTRKARRAGR
jgi:hypothetical protein